MVQGRDQLLEPVLRSVPDLVELCRVDASFATDQALQPAQRTCGLA